MSSMNAKLDAFFAEYVASFNRGLEGEPNPDGLLERYADCYVIAHPAGVMCGTNGPDLRESMAKGFEYYSKLGNTAMALDGIEITPIDGIHAMVRVRYEAAFAARDLTVPFAVTYFVQLMGDTPKIFGWVAPDEAAIMRTYGVLPESEA